MLGAVIAGGRSSRFGSDKALAMLGGRPLIDHAIGLLDHHVAAVVISGRRWGSLPSLADPAPDLGPLGGIAAALAYAEAEGFESVLTIACDMPEVPEAVLAALRSEYPAYCTAAPILGHWPAHLAGPLLRYLSIAPGPVAASTIRQAPGSPASGLESEQPAEPAPDQGTDGRTKQSRLSIRGWARTVGAIAIPSPDLRNINTPADLT